MTFTSSSTVREVAQQLPPSIRIFEAFGIDYCCGGNKSLMQASQQAGVSPERLLESLSELVGQSADPDFSPWQQASLASLTQHIAERHHAFVRNEVPRLNSLFEKVRSRHGSAHPELTPMSLLFGFLGEDMLNHMQKEEQVLFPYIQRLEQDSEKGMLPPATPFGSVDRPVECMMRDHEKTGREIQQIREWSNGFTIPEGACLTFRALYDGLREFEHDLHRHVHLENNILFPRAIELDAKACALA